MCTVAKRLLLFFRTLGELHFLGLGSSLIDLAGLMEGGNNALHCLLDRCRAYLALGIRDSLPEDIKLLLNLLAAERSIVLNKDKIVIRFLKILGLDKKLLIKLFTGTETCFYNVNVDIGTKV